MSPDPVNDHCAVRVILREAAIGEMLPLDALWRRERLHLAKWKDRPDEWRTGVKQTIEAAEPGDLDHFAILDRAKRVALTCARDISGVTGGRLRPSISNHSNEERRLQAHLRLLRVVRRDMYTRQGARPYPPSRSIKRAWDSTLHLQHAPARLVRTSGPGGDPRQARMSRKGPRPGLWMPAAAGPRPRPASVRRHTTRRRRTAPRPWQQEYSGETAFMSLPRMTRTRPARRARSRQEVPGRRSRQGPATAEHLPPAWTIVPRGLGRSAPALAGGRGRGLAATAACTPAATGAAKEAGGAAGASCGYEALADSTTVE